MNDEIEIKFPDANHAAVRKALKMLGARQTAPDRLMKRVVIHTPEMSIKDAFVRIRDEGDKVTITYKQFDSDTIDGAKEYETTVGSFDEAINIFSAAGLAYDTYQESRRETWELDGVEVMLDEWPWLQPYIEIEGPSEARVRAVAQQLGFSWDNGLFGGVANLYRHQYPFIGERGSEIINREWSEIKFGASRPPLIQE